MSGMGGSPRSSLGSTSPSSDERNSSYDSLDSPGHTGAALEAQALVFDTRLSPVARAPSTGTQQALSFTTQQAPSNATPEAQQAESPVKKEGSAGKKRDFPEKEVQPYLDAIEGLEHASLLKQSGAPLVMTAVEDFSTPGVAMTFSTKAIAPMPVRFYTPEAHPRSGG